MRTQADEGLCAPTRREEKFRNEGYQELSATARRADLHFEAMRDGFHTKKDRTVAVEGLVRLLAVLSLNVPSASSKEGVMLRKGRCRQDEVEL